jgi:hypothetical protein
MAPKGWLVNQIVWMFGKWGRMASCAWVVNPGKSLRRLPIRARAVNLRHYCLVKCLIVRRPMVQGSAAMVIPSARPCAKVANANAIVAADAAATLLSTTSKTIAGAGPDSSSAPDRYTQPDCAPDSTSAGTSNNGLDFFFVVISASLILAADETQESRVVLGGPAARRIFPDGLPLRGRVVQIDTLPDAW